MRMATQTIAEYDFRRLDHSAYLPDLAYCDFFLFGYLHQKMIGSVYETVE
jgi:hypothetical protein